MRVSLLILPALLGFSVSAGAWTLVGAGISGWNTRTLTVYVDTRNCPVEEAALLSAVDAAIGDWNGISRADISLRREIRTAEGGVDAFLAGTATQVPLIMCDSDFATHNQVDADYVPATTRLATENSHINYAGMLLNGEAETGAEISRLGAAELAITIAHELGHVLGLGHSSSKEALMYYSISGKTRAVLTTDDVDGLTYLYPRNEFSKDPFGLSCGAVHQPGSPWTVGWLWAAIVVAMNLVVGRVAVRRRPQT